MKRLQIADIILKRLLIEIDFLQETYASNGPIKYFALDNLLPDDIAMRIRAAFPAGDSMKTKRSLRELKFVAAQMNQYNPLLEEVIFAFQDPRLVKVVERITGLQDLEPDENLYAGGISMMEKNHFLNPHIDNSHDKLRERYRVLNLLYYVSPDWSSQNGGNLELWPEGPKGDAITIENRFNRLVIMVTNKTSWHSVSPVKVSQERCCISNYYFSKYSPEEKEYFHVTSFRGRPEQKVRDLVLRTDIALRSGIRKIFPKGIVENKHFYDKQ